MESLREMWEPWWLRLVFRWHLARLVRFFRRDTRFAPAAQRTSDDDGLRMLVLVRRAKRRGFDLAKMPPERSVLIEDLAFNAFLAVANRDLTQIAAVIGETIEPELAECFARTERALDELWDPETGQYYSRNAVTGELVTRSTVATFLPLWSGVTSPDQQARLAARLAAPSGFWPAHPVPSVPTDASEFEPDRYWKGPTWINMNWAVIEGLLRVGRADLAEALRQSNLDLLEHGGLAEYFSAITGEGFGAEEFSWTAALALDLLLPARKVPSGPQV
jgi:glycogen debranching enzyme